MTTHTTVKVSDTRQPRLTRAVIRQLGGRDSLEDIARNSADAGWPGFTYYSDTAKFFIAHRTEIMARAREDAGSFGVDALAMVAGFVCLKHLKLSADEVAQAVYYPARRESDNVALIRNALAWYALEEIARELNPEI